LKKKLKSHNIELIKDKALAIEGKSVITSTQKFKFEKLIIATGSKVNIPSIKGIENAFFIKKNYEYLKALGQKITLIETMSKLLSLSVIKYLGFVE